MFSTKRNQLEIVEINLCTLDIKYSCWSCLRIYHVVKSIIFFQENRSVIFCKFFRTIAHK